jgi:hypothetical protein
MSGMLYKYKCHIAWEAKVTSVLTDQFGRTKVWVPGARILINKGTVGVDEITVGAVLPEAIAEQLRYVSNGQFFVGFSH